MKLRIKLLLIFSALIVVWGTLSAYFLHKNIQEEQIALENKELSAKIDVLVNNILSNLEAKQEVVKAYSYWDAMYDFSKNKNQDFIEKELSKDTFETAGFTFMVIKDKEKNIIFSETLNKSVNLEVISQFNQDGCFFFKNEELYLSCSLGIRNSKGLVESGEEGLLTVGFLVDNEFFKKIEKSSGLVVSFENNSSSKKTGNLTFNNLNKLNFNQNVKIEKTNDNIFAYVEIKDKDSNSLGIIKLNINRENFNQLHNGLNVIENSTLLFLLVFMVVVLAVIDYFVVSEIKVIDNFFKEIQTTKKYNKRLPKISDKTQNEVEKLKININEMVDVIEVQVNELNNLAEVDSLTGLYNRRCFEARLKTIIHQNKKEPKQLALCILDIDYFKKYNDYYGHYVGDEALVKVSNVLKNHVKRTTDYVVRLGGEEFAIILENINEENAQKFFNKIINDFNEIKIPHEKSEVANYLTVSMGMAMLKEDDTFEKIFKRADSSLYAAKHQGRNRLVYLKEENKH